MSSPTNKSYIHKRTGRVYLPLLASKLKLGLDWHEAVSYLDPKTFDVYTRLKEDFETSFAIVESTLEDSQCS